MNGQDPHGRAASYIRRETARRPAPPGPLSRDDLATLAALLARGAAVLGYTDEQIAQAMRVSPRTIKRRVQGARKPPVEEAD